MSYIIVCNIFDQIFQSELDDLDDVKRFVKGNSCTWAIVLDKATGNVRIQYQKKTFMFFER